jgi:hypothetical protein
MTDKQRNVTIAVAALLLFLWYRNKKKQGLSAPEEQNAGGGGGGGGFMGGGIGLPIVPLAQTSTPPVPVTSKPVDPLDVTVKPSTLPKTGGVQDPLSSSIPQAKVSFVNATALRPIQFQSSTGILINLRQGDLVKVAGLYGSNTTYPEANPKKTLVLGTDIDWAQLPTGGFGGGFGGGVLGGGTTSGSTTGGVATGGLASGATTGGQIKL